VPHWNEILHVATRIADFIPLGYLGVDIVLDAEHGPMVLELNARPGLAIQMANDSGLETRLDAVNRLPAPSSDPHERVRLAQLWFGSAAAPPCS